MCSRGINTSNECPICSKELETTHHALLHCEFANLIWNFWSNEPQSIQRNKMTFHDSAMFILAHKPSHDLELFFTVAWAIWYNRNRVTHEDKCSSPSQVWQMAKSSIEDFNDAATIDLSTPRPIHTCNWSPPPPGVFKINVDGASSDLERTSSIGAIIRDYKGDTIAALCKPLQAHFSAKLAEVLPMKQGILLAQELLLPRVMFESDAITMINAINDSTFGTPFRHIIQDIIHTQASFEFCSFRHLNRAFNYAAMSLLNLPVGMAFHICGKGLPPPF